MLEIQFENFQNKTNLLFNFPRNNIWHIIYKQAIFVLRYVLWTMLVISVKKASAFCNFCCSSINVKIYATTHFWSWGYAVLRKGPKVSHLLLNSARIRQIRRWQTGVLKRKCVYFLSFTPRDYLLSRKSKQTASFLVAFISFGFKFYQIWHLWVTWAPATNSGEIMSNVE